MFDVGKGNRWHMKNYFKILEVNPDAEPQDIKKAYFRLIRKNSPDKEPQKFQELREAYEYLQNEKNRKLLKKVYDLPSPFREVYQCAMDFENREEIGKAIAVCKEGLKIEPGHRELNVYLAELYLKNEETGKAVKLLESLLKFLGDDIKWNSLLALAYEKRGWVKKAYSQFKKSYLMGSRDAEFLLYYAYFCLEQNYDKEARNLVLEVLKQEKELNAPDLKHLVKIFIILFTGDIMNKDFDYAGDKIFYEQFLGHPKMTSTYLRKLSMEVLSGIFMMLTNDCHETDVQEYLLNIAAREEANFSQEEIELFRMFSSKVEIEKVQKDDRLGDELKEAALEFYHKTIMTEEQYEFSKDIVEMNILEVKLMILDSMPEVWKELQIVQEEYPVLYREMEEFIKELEKKEALAYIKSKYEKKYCKMAGYPSNSRIIRNDKTMSEDYAEDDFSFYQEPYKREEPKIGRNDPCPCGSGKKYKKCCGR